MHWLTPLFIAALLAGVAVDLWLSERQTAAVARHRGEVPAPFAGSVSPDEHGKAADYTIAKVRFGRIGTVVDAVVLLALTVGGGIALIDTLWRRTGLAEPWLGVAVIATLALCAQLLSLPFSIWRTFRLDRIRGRVRPGDCLQHEDGLLAGQHQRLLSARLQERQRLHWWRGLRRVLRPVYNVATCHRICRQRRRRTSSTSQRYFPNDGKSTPKRGLSLRIDPLACPCRTCRRRANRCRSGVDGRLNSR